jgi:hypothetical protein
MAVLADRWKWSYQEMLEMPIPAYSMMVMQLQKIFKEEQRAYKKASRKR